MPDFPILSSLANLFSPRTPVSGADKLSANGDAGNLRGISDSVTPAALPTSSSQPARDAFKSARTTLLTELDFSSMGLSPVLVTPVVVSPVLASASRSVADLDDAIGVGPAGKGKGHAYGRFKHYEKLDEHGKKAYDDLEKSGRLFKPDASGLSVIALVNQSADSVTGPWMKGLDIVAVINELLINLANPAGIFQGTNTDTCTASAAQQLLAASTPVEYVRIGLALSTTGSMTCKGGQKLDIDEKAFNGEEGRSTLSDAFQGSFMKLGQSLPAGDVTGGIGLLSTTSTRKSLFGEGAVQGGVGLTEAQFNGLIDALTGQDYVTVQVTSDNAAEAILELQKALKNGPVPVALNAADGGNVGHAVMVTGVQNGIVQMWDAGLGKATSMTLEEFQARVAAINLPPSPVAERQKLRDKVVASDRYQSLVDLEAARKTAVPAN